jgi:hypothetical protein
MPINLNSMIVSGLLLVDVYWSLEIMIIFIYSIKEIAICQQILNQVLNFSDQLSKNMTSINKTHKNNQYLQFENIVKNRYRFKWRSICPTT